MTLDAVKEWMKSYGWTQGGIQGSEKIDAVGAVVGFHGGAVWIEDMKRAIEAAERQAALAEIERRERDGIPIT